jgi:hypothetical protein
MAGDNCHLYISACVGDKQIIAVSNAAFSLVTDAKKKQPQVIAVCHPYHVME